MKNNIYPELLYHGSRYQQNELMPGFKRSGRLVRWDETESNEFLYTTSDRAAAIELGFASSIEKEFDIDRFHVDENKIQIQTDKPLSLYRLKQVPLFLYTISFEDRDGWIKNRNTNNGLCTEYKTKNTIHAIVSCERIAVPAWLEQYKLELKHSVSGGDGYGKEVTMESMKSNKPFWSSWVKW